MVAMIAPQPADLSGLADLAQTRAGALRPVLLASQAALFATARRRDPASCATFEALALGLIPLVDRSTLVDVAALLELVPDVPQCVRALLAQRLGGDDDMALARDPGTVLDGRRLAELVDAARSSPELAAALLARPELSVFDRAALYRVADAAQRAAIREDLAAKLPRRSTGRLALPSGLKERLRQAANGCEAARLLAVHGIGPSQEAAESGLADSEAEREMFALALVAVGFAPLECGRYFVTLDPKVSRSPEPVFHLARLVRETPAAVAAWLADPDDRALAAEITARHVPHLHPLGGFVRPGQPLRAVDPTRDREDGGLADRRSTATRDRDRT
jgi:hypothetical protein